MKEKLLLYSVLGFAFFLPFDPDWGSKALILLIIVSFFGLKKKKLLVLPNYFIVLFVMGIYIFLNMLLVSRNVDFKSLRFVGLLTLFFLLAYSTTIFFNSSKKVLVAFSIGVYLVGFINLSYYFFLQIKVMDFVNIYNNWDHYLLVDISKIYYAMYLNLAYIFLASNFFSSRHKKPFGLLILGIITTVILLYYTGSMSGILLFLLLNSFFLLNLFKKRNRNVLMVVILISPIILMSLLTIPKVQKMFVKLDGEGSRIRNYNINVELFYQKPLFGFGIGKEREIMQSNRNIKSWEYQNNYHAHNQYLEALVGGGILYFLFIVLFLFLLCKRLLNEDKFLIVEYSFVILILYSFIIESILVRHHGLFFYAFFVTLFNFGLVRDKEEII